jgi:hypothetical protein
VLELLEPKGQPIPIRPIGPSSFRHDLGAPDALRAEFQERPFTDIEQPISDVDAEVGIDPDQVGGASSAGARSRRSTDQAAHAGPR